MILAIETYWQIVGFHTGIARCYPADYTLKSSINHPQPVLFNRHPIPTQTSHTTLNLLRWRLSHDQHHSNKQDKLLTLYMPVSSCDIVDLITMLISGWAQTPGIQIKNTSKAINHLFLLAYLPMTPGKNLTINNHSTREDYLHSSDSPTSTKIVQGKYRGWTQDELIMEFVPEEVFSLMEWPARHLDPSSRLRVGLQQLLSPMSCYCCQIGRTISHR